MQILQITPNLPFPPDEGGKVEIFNSIKHLSEYHNITLLTFLKKEDDRKYIPEMEKYAEVITVPLGYKRSLKNFIKNLVFSVPYFTSDKMKEKARELALQRKFDLVRIDGLFMAQYGTYFNIPTIFRLHNAEYMIMKGLSEKLKNPFAKIYASVMWRKIKGYEIKKCKEFDLCIAITEIDKQLLCGLDPSIKMEVITAGVDIDYFQPNRKSPKNPKQIIFTGYMSWRPNIDGVVWFAESILPLIRKEIPDVTFYIVGKDPTEQVLSLAKNQNIIVTGTVEDIRPFVHSSSVFVVPLRVGSGMRLKILEAMAMGIPVISTTIGCEGIAAEHNKNIIIADEAEAFANAVVNLLNNSRKANSIIEEGLELVNSRYSWQIIAKQFDKIYHQVLEKARKNQLKITFLIPSASFPVFHKNILAFDRLEGVKTEVLGFIRGEKVNFEFPGKFISLGNISHGKYLKRLIPFLKAIFIIRRKISETDILYANGLDMAFLAIISSKLLLRKPKFIYEVQDIREILLGDKSINKIMRKIDKYVLRQIDLLVVTSEAYVEGYFKSILGRNSINYFALENKLDRAQFQDFQIIPPRKNPKIFRIGYFGVLRCPKSWEVLKQLNEKSNGKIELLVYGIPRGLENFEKDIKTIDGIHYGGRYTFPNDLPKIYGEVDIVWAAGLHGKSNYLWAKRCRFYESCLFKRPMIALKNTPDGRIVEELNIGFCIDLFDIPGTINKILSVNLEELREWQKNLMNIPENTYIYTDDHQKLIEQIMYPLNKLG